MSAPFAVYGAALGGSCRQVKLELNSWRRRRDSNPRYGFRPYNGLANRRLQPLGHVSDTNLPIGHLGTGQGLRGCAGAKPTRTRRLHPR